jgi:prepilin-type processing-associated H-X9-DG protein
VKRTNTGKDVGLGAFRAPYKAWIIYCKLFIANCKMQIEEQVILPMQFRLSTIFLIFFMVVASLAVCCPWGVWFIAVWIDTVILFAAFRINQKKNLSTGIRQAALIIFIGIICPWLLSPLYDHASPENYRASCIHNLKQIGQSLHFYHDANKHFPLANTCNKDGKPLYSWRVEILPIDQYKYINDSLKKDESWNSTHNASVLSQFMWEYYCPGSGYVRNMTDYVAVIGPGTAWRANESIKLSDLPDGGSHTVMVVEIVNSDINWAEPRDMTVEEILENLETKQEHHISTLHPNVTNVLFADGVVRSFPSEMPISIWKKLLAGEVKDIESIVYTPSPAPERWIIILCLAVWLFSIVLLFHRAIKSRSNIKCPQGT